MSSREAVENLTRCCISQEAYSAFPSISQRLFDTIPWLRGAERGLMCPENRQTIILSHMILPGYHPDGFPKFNSERNHATWQRRAVTGVQTLNSRNGDWKVRRPWKYTIPNTTNIMDSDLYYIKQQFTLGKYLSDNLAMDLTDL